MKKNIYLFIIIVFTTLSVNAQWDESGSPITTTDNVEIKGASDEALLTVIENNASTRRRINIGASNSEVFIQHLYGTSSVPFNFKVSGSNVMTFKGLKVGIGTTNPNSKLTIIPDVDEGIALSTGRSLTNASRLDFTHYYIQRKDVNNEYRQLALNPFGGNVGIGTTDPNSKLTIIPDIDEGIALSTGRSSTNASRLDFTHYYIQRKDVNNDYKQLVLNPFGGNVGIGTTDPKSKLSVNGTIWAKEVKVTLTDGADWVFEDDYKLLSLEEVEKFVIKNKHLPEIPSADDMRKNDLSLGDMNNKLLQKVEELTLYLIEQDKENKEQRMLIEELQEEISELKSK